MTRHLINVIRRSDKSNRKNEEKHENEKKLQSDLVCKEVQTMMKPPVIHPINWIDPEIHKFIKLDFVW